jgi:membrane-associated phospholipid phosphatase
VKVKTRRAPRVLVASVAQGRTILRGFWALVCTRKLFAVALALVAMALGWLVHLDDQGLLGEIHFWNDAQEKMAHNIAWFLGTYGDYPTYNVPLALLIWVYGVATKSSHWRRVAMIAFLGATLAGLFDDGFRLTLGRPRPDTLQHTHLADGFYGPAYAFRGGYQSFPSGHAASVFGTAFALIVADLPLGIATTIFAFGVVWARMELYRHYPSDIVVGMAIGVYFGLMVGLGARVRQALPSRDVSLSSG